MSLNRSSDIESFEELFGAFFTPLCRYAHRFVADTEVVEELVQDIFIKVWEKRDALDFNAKLSSYLYTSARNQSFNYLKSKTASQEKLRDSMENEELAILGAESPEIQMETQELENIIAKGIDSLPNRCRAIFMMSRTEDMSYREIAIELGISNKTVEAQMGIALRKLKIFMGHHWSAILLPLFLIKL